LVIFVAMSARRRGTVARGCCALALLSGLLLAGCSPGLPKLDDPPRARVPGAPCPTAPKSSPKEPVLRMWCRLERRDIAGAEAAYDPRARRALGRVLPATLEVLRANRAYGRAAIVDVLKSGGTTKKSPAVIVRTGSPGGKPKVGWYRVARAGSGWAITWDTVLRFVLYANLAPDKVPFAVPRPDVDRNALVAAVRRYDALFLEGPG
jgi:hypothetical protein